MTKALMMDWLNFLTRWAHLIFGISWIGSSFYFMWLDANLEPSDEPSKEKDVEGQLWMTHSGGFYQVLRKRIGPGSMPRTLHWFKYEALFTWVSGVFMLGFVYYLNRAVYLIDPAVLALSPAQAVGLSVALLIGCWFIYDGIWITLGKRHAGWATALSLILAGLLARFLCQTYSGRGAFIHMGAIFGTIMVANVWVRILPSQQKMVDATKRGKKPDFELSGYAKRRSVHNSYMTFPVLFMMLSNHYSMATSGPHNAILLILLILFGMSFRHAMIAKTSIARRLAWIPTVATLGGLVALTSWPVSSAPTAAGSGHSAHVPFREIHAIVHTRCLACHSAHPLDKTFGASPGGFSLDNPLALAERLDKVYQRVVQTKTMPLANKTGMTDQERETFATWLSQGAPLDE